MSAPANRSFGRALGVAFVLSLCGAATLAGLAPLVGYGTALRTVIALLGFAYVLELLARSGERVGRVTTVTAWALGACLAASAGLPLVAYVLVHVGLVWLVRSLYYYSSLVPALADFGLSLLGAAFAAWAAQRTGSAWLALWCFFLAQAFHVLIPATLGRAGALTHDAATDAFARAQRTAEAAVRRLSTPR
jgi:hypothetical protein